MAFSVGHGLGVIFRARSSLFLRLSKQTSAVTKPSHSAPLESLTAIPVMPEAKHSQADRQSAMRQLRSRAVQSFAVSCLARRLQCLCLITACSRPARVIHTDRLRGLLEATHFGPQQVGDAFGKTGAGVNFHRHPDASIADYSCQPVVIPSTRYFNPSLAPVRTQLQQLTARSCRQQPHLCINPQLVPRIDDIQISHRQLANPVCR